MSSRPLSKLKQRLVRDQLWWRYYLRNADTIRQAVVDTICFGCKARLCNTCGKKLTDQWITSQKALLPNTE